MCVRYLKMWLCQGVLFTSSSKSQCEVYNLISNVFWWHLLQAKTKL